VFLYTSNFLECLFDALHAVVHTPPADPLRPEIIVVQHQAMARWLARQLALADGIAANIHFPLPARFFWDQLTRLQPETECGDDLFRKPVLRWRIARLLPEPQTEPVFADIDAYLSGDADGRKRYQLAGLIASTFDQYLVYRPDLLDRWQQGEDRHWQAVLWRRLTGEGPPLRARLAAQLRAHLAAPPAPGLLPERVHLFGLNALAPTYLECLAALAPHTAIHLYALCPCREYWGDLVSATTQARLRNRAAHQGLDPSLSTAGMEEGHPLLASLGGAGQEFFEQLVEVPDEALVSSELFRKHQGPHLLAAIQNGILDLSVPEPEERIAVAADDCSLRFHRCSSPLREVQVLHDRLLDLFQLRPELSPVDILVCAPNIGTYASVIAGVFGEAGQERHIPWSLADQSPAEEQSLVRAFLDLLDLLASRFTAPDVLALCETKALLARFGLTPGAVPRLTTWVRETGIHWGLDTDHREWLGLYPGQAHTWRFGIDRLLIGAMTGESDTLVSGRLAVGLAADADPEELGGFALLFETLEHWQNRLRTSRTPADWCAELHTLLDDCFAPEDDDEGLETLRGVIGSLATDCRLAAFDRPLSAAVIRNHLDEALSGGSTGSPFPGGRITFCNMVPMRSLPFRVICLLGMNDQDFPRSQYPPAFDLMAKQPRRGDRNRRKDDRYLFLEALLSARDVFHISWVGATQRDESVLPPSTVVLELQDLIDRICLPVDEVPASRHLTTLHPLQPFSLRCFDGTAGTASYNPAWMPAARILEPRPFLSPSEAESGLPASGVQESWEVPLEQLIRFWRHPLRFYLQQTLKLGLSRAEAPIEESELFAPDSLEHYLLRQETAQALLEQRGTADIYRNFRARGILGQGRPARCLFDELIAEGTIFVEELEQLTVDPHPALHLDLALGPFRITGQITGLYQSGLVLWRMGRMRAEDLLALWIQHLCLNLSAPDQIQPWSHFLERNSRTIQDHHLAPVDDPAALLQPLLEGFWQGQRQPLPFFPATSLAWAKAKPEQRDARAATAWTGNDYAPGESTDPAYRLVFADNDCPHGPDFEELAELFYTPILSCLDTGKETWHAPA
jgi:exodeoxyribonuclease V gamma subunit